MIYIDSTALVKLALTEPESGALAAWLAERSAHPLVSSSLHQAEVLRAIWRAEPAALPRGQRIIRRIQRVVLSQEMLDNAATVAPRKLGTAGAIHLASAIALRWSSRVTGFTPARRRACTLPTDGPTCATPPGWG